jgi:hypothetical protein
MPYLISTAPEARTNRILGDDIDLVPYIHERERWILKQARQSAARKKIQHPTVGRAFILGATSLGRATAIHELITTARRRRPPGASQRPERPARHTESYLEE